MMTAGATDNQVKSKLLDEYLVLSAQGGDRKALNQLARRWHPKLVAHAWRLTGDHELAADAVQSGWSAIIRGVGKLRDAKAFPAWAYRIVSRTCAGEIGRLVRHRELKAAVSAEPQESVTQPEGPSETNRLQAAIRQLPAGERAAIALHHFEEMRVAEVAVALAVPVGTVKTRLMNARKKLRAILEGEQS
jgi:RNA polymerase sigma-70 factor (ECF subfamily)